MDRDERYLRDKLGVSGSMITEAFRALDDYGAKSKGDEVFYEYVAKELQFGYLSEGLYLKCFAETNGDEKLAKANYAKLRVEQVSAVFKAMYQVIAREQSVAKKAAATVKKAAAKKQMLSSLYQSSLTKKPPIKLPTIKKKVVKKVSIKRPKKT
jgi:hypothetical protein